MIFIFFIFIIFIYFLKKKKKKKEIINIEKFNEDNVCRGKLTDKQFLEHMIPHHQVAIDISIMLQKISKSPVMQEILRKLIWTQKYEINLMNIMLENTK